MMNSSCNCTRELNDKLTEIIIHLKEIKELLHKQSTFNVPPTTPVPPSWPSYPPYIVTCTGETGKKQILNS